jgi:hypothetical protein
MSLTFLIIGTASLIVNISIFLNRSYASLVCDNGLISLAVHDCMRQRHTATIEQTTDEAFLILK